MDQDKERTLAAVAYILTWITGLIIYLIADKDAKYARWHAIQAIGLGIAVFVLGILLNILGFLLGSVAFLLSSLLWLGTIVLIIILAIKAYQGTQVRLPVLADFADKKA